MHKLKLVSVFIVINGLFFWLGTQFSNNISSSKKIDGSSKVETESVITSTSDHIDIRVFDEPSEKFGVSKTAQNISNTSEKSSKDQQIMALEQQLSQVSENFARRAAKEFSLMQRLNAAERALEKAGLPVPGNLQLDEAQAFLPKPFDGQVAGMSGDFADNFRNLHKADEDYDWGSDLQLRIKDFIISHQYAAFINLQSVICRQSICEIRGFQDEQMYWTNVIVEELQAAPFWALYGSFSSTGHGGSESL